MNLHISFRHMDPSQTLKDYVEEKSKKLSKYFKGKITLTWNLTVEKQSRVAHCHLVGNHMDYFGEATTDSALASVDVVIDKIEKQIRKHKEIVKDHLHRTKPSAA